MKCEICQKEFENNKALSIHLTKKHKFNIYDTKSYYDKYIDNSNHKCYFCENEARFLNFTSGYGKVCLYENCYKKTLATNTYEFLMYKYDLNQEDAIKLHDDRQLNISSKYKEKIKELLLENPNFTKEKSRGCVEYWLKRGYSLEEAKIESYKVNRNMIDKSQLYRKEHPEEFLDVNPTQLAYWIKKGYREEDALLKLKERQTTFSLEKCIEKYGEEEGLNRWKNRQEKWMKNYKKNNFSKISQELFWSIYNLINDEYKKEIYFATINNNILDITLSWANTNTGNTLPNDMRKYGLTLKVSGNTNISDIIIYGGTGSTYNKNYSTNTALINLNWNGGLSEYTRLLNTATERVTIAEATLSSNDKTFFTRVTL